MYSNNLINDLKKEIRTAKIHGILLYSLSRHEFIRPTTIAKALKSFSGGHDFNESLNQIMEHNYHKKEPFINAIIVTGSGDYPSKKFFDKARELGALDSQDETAEKTFWTNQLRELGFIE